MKMKIKIRVKNVRHSTGSARWGSPTRAIEIARAVLTVQRTNLYVDPFSEKEFNERVGALHYLDGTSKRDGYRDRWIVGVDESPRADHLLAGFGSVVPPHFSANTWNAFVNPPNATDKHQPGEATKDAWRVLDAYHRLGWLGGGAFWMAFNLNQLQTLQIGGETRSPLHRSLLRCIPDRRLDFQRHSKNNAAANDEDDSPSHPSFFVLFPSTDGEVAEQQRKLFTSLATELGEVF